MVSRNEVAKLADVSPATVSNVLNKSKYVSPELVQRTLAAVEQLNYTPNLMAKGLVTNKSKRIALLVNEISNPYYSEIAEGVEETARSKGYSVSFYIISEDIHDCFDTIRQHRYEGLFHLSVEDFNANEMRYFKDGAIAFTSMSSFEYGSRIEIDYSKAMQKAMRYLYDCGHRRIGFISGMPETAQEGRLNAYRAFMAEAGLETGPDMMRFGGYPRYKSVELGYRHTSEILSGNTGVTAIFALNDLMAYGAIQAAQHKGLSVPQDISVIGCDDIFLSRVITPGLTTISVDKTNIGKLATNLLIDQIENGVSGQALETASLVIRDTVAAVRLP